MSHAKTLLPEFDQEMADTRKVPERIPSPRWLTRAGGRRMAIRGEPSRWT
jgi:hypothetical protein